MLLDNQGGFTPPVRVTRGVRQGSVSSPELSRAAQDTLGRGMGQLPQPVLAAVLLLLGSWTTLSTMAMGWRIYQRSCALLALAAMPRVWSKFSAYASDWDAAPPPG